MTLTESDFACVNTNILRFKNFHINFWFSLNRQYIEFNYYSGYSNRYQGTLEQAIADTINHSSISTRRSNAYIYIEVNYTYDTAQELDAALQELATFIGLSIT